MTTQMSDAFYYEGKPYYVSAIEHPDEFFDIKQFGLTLGFASSACWRGYIAEFAIRSNTLVLLNLHVNQPPDRDDRVEINGILPGTIKKRKRNSIFADCLDSHYYDVNLALPYTGKTIITSENVAKLHVNMGFQSVLCFKNVIELCFENGVFVGSEDISKEVANLRSLRESKTKEKPLDSRQWVEDCFDLSYKTKFNRGAYW